MKKLTRVSVFALFGLLTIGAISTISRTASVIETKAEGFTYVDKELDMYGLQTNLVKAADNRFTLSLLVPASVDHPETAELRGAYYTNGDGKALNTIAECPSDFTYDACLNRMKALNLLQGNLEVDDHPMTYYTNTNRTIYRLHDTTQGRVVLTKNADSTTDATKMRLKIQLDVNIPNYDTGMHVVTLKAGTELPSWSYALGTQIGSTSANTVYRVTKDVKWILTWNGSQLAVSPKSLTNVQPECVGTLGWNTQNTTDMAKMSKTWQVATGRVGFSWDTISNYARYANDSAHGYNGSMGESQIHYVANPDYKTYGNATQLAVWEKILINGEAASKYYNDDRFRINGASSVEDGKSYGRMWADFKTANLGTSDLTIKILKGFQLPTPETTTNTSKATYLTTDRDWTFTYRYNSEFSWTCTSIVAGEEDASVYNTENTSVTGATFRMATGDHSFCYASFKLSNFDSKNVNTCFNNKSLYWSGAYNAFDKIYVNGDPTKTIYKTYGDASGRSYRVCMYNSEVGFPIGFSELAVPCTSITIPAGTRFPSESTFSNVNNASQDAVAVGQKFYVTTEDVTLVQRNGAWITEAAATAIDDAVTYAETFLSTVTCDNGTTAPSVEAWNTMATAYAALSAEAKTLIKNANSSSPETVQQAVARYDYIVAKYGVSAYSNFMARTVASAPVLRSNVNNTTNVTAIVAAASIIAVTAIAGLAISKKKKEN